MDVLLEWDQESGVFDLPIAGSAVGESIRAAMESRIFTDRLALDGDVSPGDDRRGWAGDIYHPQPGPVRRVGSRLWVLRRRLVDAESLRLAREYLIECLDDLRRDAVVARIDVRVWRGGINTIAGQARAYARDGRLAADVRFDNVWQGVG